MSSPLSDRNLLVGVLALQFGLVSRDQLVDAISAWGSDKSQPLDEIFVRQKAITPEHRQRLAELVALHVQLHGGDVEKSLAALSSIAEVRSDLRRVDDSDLEASLFHLKPEAPAKEPDPDATLSVGTTTSDGARFRILRPHAKGGLGEVSVAFDAELNREVALKEIQRQHADHSDSRSRFLLEAQITGGLEHPGIVPVYGMGTYADGRPFYAMRFIRGDSLKDGIQKFFAQYAKSPAKDGPESVPKLPARAFESFEFRKLLQRFIDVCNAIAYAHARGVLHRDLKPGNIMLGKYGETLVVDWGLAKATGQRNVSFETSQAPLTPSTDSSSAETLMGSAFGTPAYMSPEQATGQVDQFGPATDIYCLGATLYHMLTGQQPHRYRDIGQLLVHICAGEFPKPRDLNHAIPIPLAAICLKAMATAPADRYDSALALAADIEHWLADDPVTAHCDSIGTRLRRWSRRHRTIVMSAAALILTATITLAISYFTLQVEQSRTLSAKKNAEKEKTNAELAQKRAEEAERRERVERTKTEQALIQSQQQLAANYLQHGVAEYDAGRVDQALSDLGRAIDLSSDQRFAASYRRVFVDRALQHGNLIAPYFLHDGGVESVSFSPDGTRIVTASRDSACLWDAHSGESLAKPLRHDSSVWSAMFSPDGRLVVTASQDKTARLWNAQTGLPTGNKLEHDGPVRTACFSPDGSRVITASDDKTVRIWDARTGNLVMEPLQHEAEVVSAEYSSDGKRLVTASSDGSARLWNAESGVRLGELLKHQKKVWTAHFDSDGTRVVTASADKTARLWDGHTGASLGKPLSHQTEVVSATFITESTRVLTVSLDTSAHYWDSITGESRGGTWGHRSLLSSVNFSPDEKLVAVGCRDQTACIWDRSGTYNKPQVMLHHDGVVTSAVFSPDGTRVATVSADKTSRLWAAPANMLNPIHETVLCSTGRWVVTGSEDGVARLWDVRTGTLIGKPIRHESLYAANVDARGTRLLTCGYDKGHVVRLWDLQTGSAIGASFRAGDWIASADLSQDESRVVITVRRSKSAIIWDVKTGAQLGDALTHKRRVLSARFSPSGNSIVTGSEDATACLWDGFTGKSLNRTLQHEGCVYSAVFSSDGKRILTAGDRATRIWEAKTGVLRGGPFWHDSTVYTAAFSPDERWVLTTTDSIAQVWDAESGLPLGQPLRHQYDSEMVGYPLDGFVAKFSPDGTRVVTGSWMTDARVWDAQTGVPLGKRQRRSVDIGFRDDWRTILSFGGNSAFFWNESLEEFAKNSEAVKLLRGTICGETDEPNGYRKLSLDERLADRAKLLAHPAWQSYRRALEPRLAPKHRYYADEAERDKHWFAASWHLERLVKQNPDDEQLKQRWENAKQKWQEQKAEWERHGREVNAAREQVGPKAE